MRQSLAQVRRRSWAPKRSTPISFADLPALRDRTQHPALLDGASGHPGIDSLFDPDRHSYRPNASSLPFEIGQHPAALPKLDGLDIEGG